MVSERRECRTVVRVVGWVISPTPTMTVPSKSCIELRGTPWPFPTHPLKPWTKKQEEQYQQQQRNKLPEAPL
jgi:hypothetical protein